MLIYRCIGCQSHINLQKCHRLFDSTRSCSSTASPDGFARLYPSIVSRPHPAIRLQGYEIEVVPSYFSWGVSSYSSSHTYTHTKLLVTVCTVMHICTLSRANVDCMQQFKFEYFTYLVKLVLYFILHSHNTCFC